MAVASRPTRKRTRKALAAIVLFLLGRGLVSAARFDRRVRAEIALWPDDTLITIAIAPDGPRVNWRYDAGRLSHLGGRRLDAEPALLVTYKSVDVALPVLLGRKGILEAFAEHRSTLAGDIAFGMSLVRCLHIVESYLFPDLITRPILPTKPLREVFRGRVYAGLLAASAQVVEAR